MMPALDYKDFVAETVFDLKPEVALQAFRAKGLKATFAWQDMLGDEHLRAFTVAKMMDMDMLSTTRDLVDKAMDEGLGLEWFKAQLLPELQAKGWWGKQIVTDPLTRLPIKAQLGNAWRLETIFRTNMQTAYSIGSWQGIQDYKAVAPYLMYDAIDDHRTRPAHAEWDETVLPVDDPWWNTHHPTNGWNCRCGTIQLTGDQVRRQGLEVSKSPELKYYDWENPRTGKVQRVPEGLDPGWDTNAGKTALANTQSLMAEKIAALPKEYRAAVSRALELGELAIATAQAQLAAQQAQAIASRAKAKAALEARMVKARAEADADSIKQETAAREIERILVAQPVYLGVAMVAVLEAPANVAMDPVELLNKAKAKAVKAARAASTARK